PGRAASPQLVQNRRPPGAAFFFRPDAGRALPPGLRRCGRRVCSTYQSTPAPIRASAPASSATMSTVGCPLPSTWGDETSPPGLSRSIESVLSGLVYEKDMVTVSPAEAAPTTTRCTNRPIAPVVRCTVAPVSSVRPLAP